MTLILKCGIILNMKNEIQKFKVSCSGWEVEVDEDSFESASVSGLIVAIRNFGSNLLLSTTIMVSKSKVSTEKIITNSEFFSTEKVLDTIGLSHLSKGLSIISRSNLAERLSVES